MPFSSTHRYVHVCILKTGTTSVTRAFHQFHCEHGGSYALMKDEVDSAFRDRYNLWEIGDPQPGRAKHLSALQLKYILGEEFDRCLKFTFVRNPWARCISQYHYTRSDHEPSAEEKQRRGTRRGFHDLSFKDWLNRRFLRWKADPSARNHNQLRKIVDQDGSILVDFIGRLEAIQAGMNAICNRLGIPHLAVPKVNPTRHRPYTEYYDSALRCLVAEMYAQDIETFS